MPFKYEGNRGEERIGRVGEHSNSLRNSVQLDFLAWLVNAGTWVFIGAPGTLCSL